MYLVNVSRTEEARAVITSPYLQMIDDYSTGYSSQTDEVCQAGVLTTYLGIVTNKETIMRTANDIILDFTGGVQVERLSHSQKDDLISEMAQVIKELNEELESQ